MRYYLDTEFNGFGGALISLALVGEDDSYLYLIRPNTELDKLELDPWVAENVMPYIFEGPGDTVYSFAKVEEWGEHITRFFGHDEFVHVFADWPSDIADLCNLLISGPGTAYPMGHHTQFSILRHFDVYPTTLEGAIQHNALWDAMALKQWVKEHEA